MCLTKKNRLYQILSNYKYNSKERHLTINTYCFLSQLNLPSRMNDVLEGVVRAVKLGRTDIVRSVIVECQTGNLY